MDTTPPSAGAFSAIVSLATALCLNACYSSEPMDDATLERLAQLGFRAGFATRNGDTIIVEDDIVLEHDALLAGEYDPPANRGPDLVEKGYVYTSGPVSAVHARNIKLAWASGAREPNSKVKAAFVAAAAAWSAIPGSALRIHEQSSGPAITVHMVNADLWPPAESLDCVTTSACASFPKRGKQNRLSNSEYL